MNKIQMIQETIEVIVETFLLPAFCVGMLIVLFLSITGFFHIVAWAMGGVI